MITLTASYLEIVVTADNATFESNCTSIEFLNQGEQTATINNVSLATGDSREIKNQQGTLITQTFAIAFSGTGTKQLIVTKENYS